MKQQGLEPKSAWFKVCALEVRSPAQPAACLKCSR